MLVGYLSESLTNSIRAKMKGNLFFENVILKGEILTQLGLTCLHTSVKQATSTQVGFNKQHKLQNKLESNKETNQVRIILANIK